MFVLCQYSGSLITLNHVLILCTAYLAILWWLLPCTCRHAIRVSLIFMTRHMADLMLLTNVSTSSRKLATCKWPITNCIGG